MGLSLEVGVLSNRDDQESYDKLKSDFKTINRLLRKCRLPLHKEPVSCRSWSGDMIGYSGLHYLRRVAAHLQFAGKLPRPCPKRLDPVDDPFVKKYYRESKQIDLKMRFDHLLIHSDCDGYYLPKLPDIIVSAKNEKELTGGYFGSSTKLLSECLELARAFDLPRNMAADSPMVGQAVENYGNGTGWKKYGIEIFTCLRLMEACNVSIKMNAALVFT